MPSFDRNAICQHESKKHDNNQVGQVGGDGCYHRVGQFFLAGQSRHGDRKFLANCGGYDGTYGLGNPRLGDIWRGGGDYSMRGLAD